MPPTPKWRSITRATSTPAATKAEHLVVRASDISASSPGDKDPLFEPANSKVYRHPTFFPMPEEIKHM